VSGESAWRLRNACASEVWLFEVLDLLETIYFKIISRN
jgi:hypothetical protein